MKKILLFLILNYCLLFSNSIILNLDTAIDIALKNNEQKKISKLAFEIANAQYNQALSANYPTLDLDFIATRRDESINMNIKGEIPLSDEISKGIIFSNALNQTGNVAMAQNIANSTSLNQSLSIDSNFELINRDNSLIKLELKYPIYTGGKIQSIINQAKLNKQIKSQEINLQDDEIIFLVKQIYYGHILAKQIYKTMQNSYIKMLAIRDLTKRLYKNESLNIKKTDFLKTNITVTLMKVKLEEYKSNIQLTKNALKNILAIDYTDDIKIVEDSLSIDNLDNYLNKDINSLYKEALLSNPITNKINLALKVQNEKIQEAKSQYFPTIAVFASTTKLKSSETNGLYTDENKNNWLVGINANINIFSGFKNEYEILEQKLNKKKMQSTKKLINDSIILNLQNALVKSNEIFTSINNYKQANFEAITHRDLNLKAYRIDMVDTKEMIESQVIQTKTEVLYYNSLYDYIISTASIDKLLSKK